MKINLLILFAALLPQTVLAVDAQATLQWSQRVELTTPVAGVVQTVSVDIGDTVKKGQVLLTLDSTIYQAAVAASQAAISRLSAEGLEAKREFDRVYELYARSVVSTSELDSAKLRLTKAESMLAEARATMRQQQKMLDDTSLRAPFDAVVIDRKAEIGTSIGTALHPQILFVLAKSGEMLARLQLLATQLERLKAGQSVAVIVDGKNYDGKIKSVGLEPSKQKDDTSYQVDVLFMSKLQMRSALPATVRLP